MDDPKPRHEAYSYASASDIEPADEFPILYRLLTAEGKGTKRSSSSSSFISSNHSYFPINHYRRSRKNAGDNANKDGLISSTVEADSTSDISLTHILARSKFVSNHEIGRQSRSGAGRNGNGGSSRPTNKRKGKKNEKVKDGPDDDAMLPSSTTKDEDEDYFYNSNSSPPRKRPKFPQSLKRALSYKKSEFELEENKTTEDGEGEESQEPLLVSSLSVNERLAVLLGQQQVNNTNNNNSNDETEPPNLVPYNNNNLIVNTQSNDSRTLHYQNHEGGALRTLLSRPPRTTSSSSHNRRLIFPHAAAAISTPASCPFPAAATAKTPAAKDERSSDGDRDAYDENQKKILIKGVVEQLRAAASQRLNSFFSFKRSCTSSNPLLLSADTRNCNNLVFDGPQAHARQQQAAELDDVSPHKCSHCDLTFSRLHHLSQHEATVHPKREKFFCSLCSQEFHLSREGFQTHVEECFDKKYPPQPYTKKTDKKEDGGMTLAKYSAAVPKSESNLRTSTKQYVGLSELLEAKVEDSSSFHSFVLPTKYLE